MPVSIPCIPGGVSRFTQRTTLGGRDYQLTFDWNQRDGHWRLDVADQDGAPIKSGVVLVTNTRLLDTTDTRAPAGPVVIVDTLGRREDPGFSDLGERFLMLYFDPSEITP